LHKENHKIRFFQDKYMVINIWELSRNLKRTFCIKKITKWEIWIFFLFQILALKIPIKRTTVVCASNLRCILFERLLYVFLQFKEHFGRVRLVGYLRIETDSFSVPFTTSLYQSIYMCFWVRESLERPTSI